MLSIGDRNQTVLHTAASNRLSIDDKDLDFCTFCRHVRERNIFDDPSDARLKVLFQTIDRQDKNETGRITMQEFFRFALRQVLARDVMRVCAIFEAWDEDGNGMIDSREFRRAIQSLGFADIPSVLIDQLFAELDVDQNAELSRCELERRLKQFAGLIVEQTHELRTLDDAIRSQKGAALATTVKLDMASTKSVAEQLREALSNNLVRVVDLFHDWDEDENGMIDKNEFFKGMGALGVKVSRADANALFDSFDRDGSGTIEYRELNKLLRQRVTKRLRRVASEPIKARLRPPGASRSALLESMTPTSSQQANVMRLAPIRAPVGNLHSPSMASALSRGSAMRVNPFAYTNPYAPQRMEISQLAQDWWAPLHGQRWRHRRSQLPPLHKQGSTTHIKLLSAGWPST